MTKATYRRVYLGLTISEGVSPVPIVAESMLWCWSIVWELTSRESTIRHRDTENGDRLLNLKAHPRDIPLSTRMAAFPNSPSPLFERLKESEGTG